MGSHSDDDSSDLVLLLIATICDTIKLVLKGTKMSYKIKKETQAISNTLEGGISMDVAELPEVTNLTVQTSAVSVFSLVSLANMASNILAMTKHSVLWLVIQYLHVRGLPKGSAISKIRCKAVCKYLL